jgi:hypothetical protein
MPSSVLENLLVPSCPDIPERNTPNENPYPLSSRVFQWKGLPEEALTPVQDEESRGVITQKKLKKHGVEKPPEVLCIFTISSCPYKLNLKTLPTNLPNISYKFFKFKYP